MTRILNVVSVLTLAILAVLAGILVINIYHMIALETTIRANTRLIVTATEAANPVICSLPFNITTPGTWHLCQQNLTYDATHDDTGMRTGLWIQTSHVHLRGHGGMILVKDTAGVLGYIGIRVESVDGVATIMDTEISDVTVLGDAGTTAELYMAGALSVTTAQRSGGRLIASLPISVAYAGLPLCYGIKVIGATNVLIERATIQNHVYYGVYLARVNSVIVRESVFLDNFDATGINMTVSLIAYSLVYNLEVDRCRFHCTVEPPLEGDFHPTTLGVHSFDGLHQNFHIHDSQFSHMTSSINIHAISGLLVERCQIRIGSVNAYNGIQLGYFTVTDVYYAYNVIIRDTSVETLTSLPYVDGIGFIAGSGALFENVALSVSCPQDAEYGCEPYCDGPLYFGLTEEGVSNVLIRGLVISGVNTTASVMIMQGSNNIVFRDSSISDGTYLVTLLDTAEGIVFDRTAFSGLSNASRATIGLDITTGSGHLVKDCTFQFIADDSSVIVAADVEATIITSNQFTQCGCAPVADAGDGTISEYATIANIPFCD